MASPLQETLGGDELRRVGFEPYASRQVRTSQDHDRPHDHAQLVAASAQILARGSQEQPGTQPDAVDHSHPCPNILLHQGLSALS